MELNDREYLEQHGVHLYLNDALRLMVASGSSRPIRFIRDYLRRCVGRVGSAVFLRGCLPSLFRARRSLLTHMLPLPSSVVRSVKDGSNVLSREYSYVSASPRNRIALVRCVRKAGGELARSGGDAADAAAWTLADHYEIFRLVCPDFDRSLVARTAHFLGVDVWQPMAFRAAAVAMQHSFFYREFLEEVDAMLPPSAGLDDGSKARSESAGQPKQSERDVSVTQNVVLLALARCRALFEFPPLAPVDAGGGGGGGGGAVAAPPRKRGERLRRLYATSAGGAGGGSGDAAKVSLYVAVESALRSTFARSGKAPTNKGQIFDAILKADVCWIE